MGNAGKGAAFVRADGALCDSAIPGERRTHRVFTAMDLQTQRTALRVVGGSHNEGDPGLQTARRGTRTQTVGHRRSADRARAPIVLLEKAGRRGLSRLSIFPKSTAFSQLRGS